MSYKVSLPVFEGPFDLLLFFIERDELDIYDIPMSKITKDFLAYIQDLQKANIDVAGDFILVAASLMRIKAKMLLPRQDPDEDGNPIDPRQELVQQLLEYKRVKPLIEHLANREDNMLKTEKRGNLREEMLKIGAQKAMEAELEEVDLYKLLSAFIELQDAHAIRKAEAARERKIESIKPYPYTVNQQKEYLMHKVKDKKWVYFSSIFIDNPDRIAVIFTFLAILELTQAGSIGLETTGEYNQFRVFYKAPYIPTDTEKEEVTPQPKQMTIGGENA